MELESKAAGAIRPPPPLAVVDANGPQQQLNGTAAKKVHKKKSQKHKSRNDFSDVQRIELDSVVAPQTTIDLLKSATDLEDLSKKLGERLNLATQTNGSHDTTTTTEEEEEGVEEAAEAVEAPRTPEQPNHLDNQTVSPSSNNMIYCGPANEVIHVAESGIESEGPSTAHASPTSAASEVASPKSLSGSECASETKIEYREYESELQMPDIIRLIQRDLSEPYSIYTYRYFIHNWPKLCFLAMHGDLCVGAIVCKLGMHRQIMKRGYIAMLAVDKEYRKLKIGTNLVQKAIEAMLREQADEVVLETEITNTPALRLYENLGFVRDKRLFHYYLNGVDALRLKLWFR